MSFYKRIRDIEKQVFTGYLALPNIKYVIIFPDTWSRVERYESIPDLIWG